jgi:type IV pilus assembly protein PilX
MTPSLHGRIRGSGGFALITALLLLVGLTLLSVTALRTSVFDEKAAGNVAFRGQGYQLAEAALTQSLAYLDTVETKRTKYTAGTPGLITADSKAGGASAETWKDKNFWTAANTIEVPVPGIAPKNYPRFVVEYLTQVNEADDSSVGSGRQPILYEHLRITSRAIDPTTGAAVILQMTYKRGIKE